MPTEENVAFLERNLHAHLFSDDAKKKINYIASLCMRLEISNAPGMVVVGGGG